MGNDTKVVVLGEEVILHNYIFLCYCYMIPTLFKVKSLRPVIFF